MQERKGLKEQLSSSRDSDWVDTRLKMLAPRPGKNRETLRSLIEPISSRYDDDKYVARIYEVVEYFAELSDKQRMKLWEVLFPKLAPHFERAWLDAGNRPYQSGSTRRGFRAHNRPETVAYSRARFFVLACEFLRGLNVDSSWLAAWAPHLTDTWWKDGNVIAWLLAGVLNNGGEEAEKVREVFRNSIAGDHEIGQMGQHIVVAMLNSEEREDWETIGTLLLAAKRQEGLRKSILEAVDEANPGAFRYMLGVIKEHDLGRFSSTARAFDVWLGFQWVGGLTQTVHDGVTRLIAFFDDESARNTAIEEGEPEDAYLALWATAFQDAEAALALAAPMLDHEEPERRFVALQILEWLQLFPDTLDLVARRLMSGKEDDDRVQMAIASFFADLRYESVSDELFEATGRWLHALPARPKKLDPIVWPWARFELDRRHVANALKAMAKGSPDKLVPFARALNSSDCAKVIREIAGIGEHWTRDPTGGPSNVLRKRTRRKLTPEARQLMIELTCDTRQYVQRAAFEAIATIPVEQDEIDLLLANLHRSAEELRKGAIERLSQLPDSRVLELISTLLADKHAKKRAAGLELASQLVENNRSREEAQSIVSAHRDALSTTEMADVADRLLADRHEPVSHDDCLGLVPSGSRVPTVKPRFVGIALGTAAARACLQQLAELFLEHADTEVELPRGTFDDGGPARRLLADAGSRFPTPTPHGDATTEAEASLPLADVWLDWLATRDESTRDPDGLELVRAAAWAVRRDAFTTAMPEGFEHRDSSDLREGFCQLLKWMPVLSRPTNAGAMLTQLVEDSLAWAALSTEEKRELPTVRGLDGRWSIAGRFWICSKLQEMLASLFTREDKARLAALAILALEQDKPGCHDGPSVENFVAAFDAGLVNERDLVWHLLHPRKAQSQFGHSSQPRIVFGPIRDYTRVASHKMLGDRDQLISAVDQVRERLVELELTRGEGLTPASIPANKLHYSGGADVLFQLATALGRNKIVRQEQWGDPTRSYSFSHLISVTGPGPDDSQERFTELFEESKLKPERLLELAMFAPQWASHAEHALRIAGLESAVWWIHAHTKEALYWRSPDFRELWAAQINERTELEPSDLEEGAVDVAWFKRVIAQVGVDGWQRLQKPAKYASKAGGHKRAQLFADAMLGRVTTEVLVERIDEKRHQDTVRAFGLAPLPTNGAEARVETLHRYKRLVEFKRESREFGNLRQASEARAVEIAMQNLARTAGYRDPRRLQWAMEAEAIADLKQGPVEVKAEETTVSLTIGDSGAPELTVLKNGKYLKNVPAKLKKHEAIAELRARVTELRRQQSRMRQSLEESMARGDEFTASEVHEFFAHPMLRPMVERLVFIGEGDLVGYPEKDGRILRGQDGSVEPLGKRDAVRIAHPIDLLDRGDWHAWQRGCFAAERIQPFKQVFREVYPKTNAELNKCDMTSRYAGHQVNPRQALSLLKQRLWVHSPDEGVRRIFHDDGIIAELWFQEHFFTPAEVEDLTLEGVTFIRRNDNARERILMEEVPDRVFSEAMRDLDLVVSVAHSGGIDPEASASTVEMRATLLRELCQLLGLNNVRIKKNHVLIDGTRASYSVHLGSATTSITPGRVLHIVAVHSQYRGRLFLPFADNDPKTGEVLAKTLLLARDDEIKDPIILDQIRS